MAMSEVEQVRRILAMKEDYVRHLIERGNWQGVLQVCNQIASLREGFRIVTTKKNTAGTITSSIGKAR